MVATLVSLLFSAVFAHAGIEDAELRVQFANNTFQEALYRCPERVWPGMNWSTTGAVFVSADLRKAWFITQGLKAPVSIGMSREFQNVSEFKIATYRGKTVAIVNLDKYFQENISMPTALAVHELFHAVGQAGWKMPAQKRGDFFPLDAKPRVARAMILAEFQKYSSGDLNALGRAAYWFNIWKAEAPDELRFTTDGREGTAKYVERIALELGRYGCSANIVLPLEQWVGEQSPINYFGLDAEGYVLGAVAGILLDRSGVEWKTAVKQGASPLDLLLNTVTPTVGLVDPAFTRDIDIKVYSVNAEVSHLADPLTMVNSADAYYRIVVPDTWIGPSLGLLGIFVPRTSPDQTYLIFSYGQEFSGGRRGSWMTLTSPALGLVRGDDKVLPCGYRGIEFLVPKAQVSKDGDMYAGHTGNVDFEFTARAVVSRDGLIRLCPVTR